MEEKGLIERKPNPEDGRSVLICLTDFGIEMREYSKEVVFKFDTAIRETVDPQKLEIFIEVFQIINDLVSNKKIYKQQKNSLI